MVSLRLPGAAGLLATRIKVCLLGLLTRILTSHYRQAKAVKAEREANLAPENQRRLPNLDQPGLDSRYSPLRFDTCL
jgi:hypothetical protein